MNNRVMYATELSLLLALSITACSDTPPSTAGSTGSSSSSSSGGGGGSGGAGGEGGGIGVGGGGGGTFVCVEPERMDVLFALDNSRSMADKQAILERAVPDLVQGMINPPCLDPMGVKPATQPASPADTCPMGLERAFIPRSDIHFGVISSSIGGHGADSCPNSDSSTKECQPNPNLTNNDRGQLIARLNQCGGPDAPTYQSKKFLAWDPGQKLMPPGESQVDDGMGFGLVPTLRDMVKGIGQIGCGYESQFESIYRFLVDPEPYETITVIDFKATPSGIDQVVLDQRKAFLRPDSLLTIIMLTDENDCSTKEYGQFYYVGQLRNGASPVRLPRSRQECATNPNDPCCKSCGQAQGNCPIDPTCQDPNGGAGPALLSDTEDNINLRCWDQKRRFGIDFLYPIDRYTQAFTKAVIANRAGDLVANPLFMDLDPTDEIKAIRGPERVLFTSIVGVPWQDIARNKTDISKGFKNAAELTAPIAGAGTPSVWDVIVGNPPNYVKPLDPLMVETFQMRSGTNPITGDAIANASMPNSNPINGHDWTISNDDLQYACIFPLLPGTERDCTNTNLTACDCTNQNNDSPLCQADPNNANKPTLQVRAKAYPGIRQLELVKSLEDQGLIGSICPAQLSDATAQSYGYRPVVNSLVDWLTRRKCITAPN